MAKGVSRPGGLIHCKDRIDPTRGPGRMIFVGHHLSSAVEVLLARDDPARFDALGVCHYARQGPLRAGADCRCASQRSRPVGAE